MSRWSDLPPELLKLITHRQTNYVDYLSVRSVCRPWRSALPKRPHDLLRQLPWLLLSCQKDSPNCRGFHNLSDGKTYSLELPEANEKLCCGSSHGWLVVVEESSAIFLLNPLTKARIELPSLSTFLDFPVQVLDKYSRNLHLSSNRSSKQLLPDRFIRKIIVSADPSLVSNFIVMAIYGTEHESLAFCTWGEIAWTTIEETSPPLNYKDIMFHAGNFYVVDEKGRVSICNITDDPPTLVHIADPPSVSTKLGYKEWYLTSLNEHISLVGRFRKYNVVTDYPYQTRKFVVFKLETRGSNWSKVESLEDKILFLGWNCVSVSALDFGNCKGNSIYFTDDNFMVCSDYIWEGHYFGILDYHDGSIQRLGLPTYRTKQPLVPNIFSYERSSKRDRSKLILQPPIWITISP